ELLGGARLALFDGAQDAGHLAHESHDNRRGEDWQERKATRGSVTRQPERTDTPFLGTHTGRPWGVPGRRGLLGGKDPAGRFFFDNSKPRAPRARVRRSASVSQGQNLERDQLQVRGSLIHDDVRNLAIIHESCPEKTWPSQPD